MSIKSGKDHCHSWWGKTPVTYPIINHFSPRGFSEHPARLEVRHPQTSALPCPCFAARVVHSSSVAGFRAPGENNPEPFQDRGNFLLRSFCPPPSFPRPRTLRHPPTVQARTRVWERTRSVGGLPYRTRHAKGICHGSSAVRQVSNSSSSFFFFPQAFCEGKKIF